MKSSNKDMVDKKAPLEEEIIHQVLHRKIWHEKNFKTGTIKKVRKGL